MLGLPREPFLLLGLNGGQSSPQDNSTGRPHWEGRTTTHYEVLRGTTTLHVLDLHARGHFQHNVQKFVYKLINVVLEAMTALLKGYFQV